MATQRPTILVVEDVGLVRMNLAMGLQDAGFNVLEASSADSAISVLERGEGPVDIVLTDLNMPGAQGGAALLRWLSTNRPRIVRAVCTAHAGLAPIEDVTTESLVFEKPFDPVRLSSELWSALSLASQDS
jgi:DNA-binding NtrC family response regulator